MYKSIKLKNDTFWDSSGISHNRLKLNDILSKLTIYRGERILFNSQIDCVDTSKTSIKYIYGLKDYFTSAYPTIPGFTRKYYLNVTFSNNHNGSTYLYIDNDLVFQNGCWGNVNDMSWAWKDITDKINNLSTGHKRLYGSNSVGGTSRFYYISLLVYDILQT